MSEGNKAAVPVWTLATRDVRDVAVPPLGASESMTPARLDELRTALATLADAPIATLEAHPVPVDLDRKGGIHLDSASPLATHLSQLISQTTKAAPKVSVAAGGEVLYRMVVPAKVAAQVGSGLVKPMASKAASGGVYSALMGSSKIAAQATFVPVAGKAAAVGAAGGSAATAGAAVAGAGALTVAAPLVLMAVAVGVSAHADHKRQQAIDNITDLLEQLHDDALQRERSALNGCRSAIEKATAILLDRGQIGVSLGLDSASYAIDVALADTEERLKKWRIGLDEVDGRPVEIGQLQKTFDGIDGDGGKFRAYLELADLAIALKKRVIVLQAVEHSQLDPSNAFEAFVGTLKRDQQRVTELEAGIATVLLRLSTLELDRPRGFRDKFFTPGEVDKLLGTSYRLRELGNRIPSSDRPSDVAIEMFQSADGSITVYPATAAA